MPSRDVAVCGRFGSRQALPKRRQSTATSIGRRMYWAKDGHPLRMRVGTVVRTLLRRGRGWWQGQECAYAGPKSSRTVDVRSSRAKVGRRETADKKWSSKVVDTAGDHQVDIDFGSGGGSFETTERQARLFLGLPTQEGAEDSWETSSTASSDKTRRRKEACPQSRGRVKRFVKKPCSAERQSGGADMRVSRGVLRYVVNN